MKREKTHQSKRNEKNVSKLNKKKTSYCLKKTKANEKRTKSFELNEEKTSAATAYKALVCVLCLCLCVFELLQ